MFADRTINMVDRASLPTGRKPLGGDDVAAALKRFCRAPEEVLKRSELGRKNVRFRPKQTFADYRASDSARLASVSLMVLVTK
jgi:hypothetical protein